MSKREVVEFTCDAQGCTDFIRVPLNDGTKTVPINAAVQVAKEQGWSAKVNAMYGIEDYCPVHRSHSGWDWQGDYPTAGTKKNSNGLEEDE